LAEVKSVAMHMKRTFTGNHMQQLRAAAVKHRSPAYGGPSKQIKTSAVSSFLWEKHSKKN